MDRRSFIVASMSTLASLAASTLARATPKRLGIEQSPNDDVLVKWTFVSRKVPRWLLDCAGKITNGWRVESWSWSGRDRGCRVEMIWRRRSPWVMVTDGKTTCRFQIYQRMRWRDMLQLAVIRMYCKVEQLP